MELKRAGSQPSMKGPEQYFTGSVRIDRLNNPPAPARASSAYVMFEPGARSAWHTHPLGHKHWHGATATTAMTHIAVTEALDGVNVVWLDKVSDADYLSPVADAAHAH